MERHEKTGRNRAVDVLRGIAMLMVIFGHTMSTCGIVDFEDTILFRVIWSLQMPLFILISGYVAYYGKSVKDFKAWSKVVCKKTVAYLLPWFVWTVAVNGFLKGNCSVADVLTYMKHILFHMDSGYWFLVCIWIINVLHSLAVWVTHRLGTNRNLHFLLVAGGMFAVLLIPVVLWGASFLGLKYVLYYAPIFYLGWLLHRYECNAAVKVKYENWKEIGVFLSFVIYCISILYYNSYLAQDGIVEIALRYLQSITGCITVAAAVQNIAGKQRLCIGISYLGRHTMELYVVHNLFLGANIRFGEAYSIGEWQGFAGCMLNFLVTLLLTLLFCNLARASKICRLVLFGIRGKKVESTAD